MRNNGFTMVELMVVFALIGILAGVALLVINPIGQFNKAKDSKRKSDLAQLKRSIEVYYNDNGQYPTSLSQLEPTYVEKVPVDPGDGTSYAYEPVIAGVPQFGVTCTNTCAYVISTKLENTQDVDRVLGCDSLVPAHDYCVKSSNIAN